LVEAIIVEVSDNKGKEFGVQWMYTDTKNGFGSSTDGSGQLGALGAGAIEIRPSNSQETKDKGLYTLADGLSKIAGQTFGVARLGERTNFLGLLKMLQTQSNTNVLSTPNLLTTDNKKASISVGQKVPFKTGSYSGTTSGNNGGNNSFSSPFNTIQRESVGIKLEVTPHINEGDTVILDINQEVSDISDKNNPDGPITSERKIDTQVLTADGQTIVLGGMIKDDVQVGSTRVPLLGSIPVVGKLFRTETSSKIKTNLLVFIRATVIREDKVLEGATAEKYKNIRAIQQKNHDAEGGKAIPVLPEWEDKLVVPASSVIPPSDQQPVIANPQVEPLVLPAQDSVAPSPAIGN